MFHADYKWIIDGLWRGEMKCIDPRVKDADLWILTWEVHRVHQEGTLLEVEHVKSASLEEGKNSKCRYSKNLSLKAMKRQMS